MRRHRTAAPKAVSAPHTSPSPPHAAAMPRTHSALRRFLGTYTAPMHPERRLRVARTAFDMIMHDEAACAALSKHGYDAKVLQDGHRRLAIASRRLLHHHHCERTLAAARHMDAVVQERAFLMYRRCFQIVRRVIRDNPAFIDAVNLKLPRHREIRLWQSHARELHESIAAHPQLAAILSEHGFSTHLLRTLQQQMNSSTAGRELRHIAQARAALARRASAHTIASFDRWMHKFLVVAQLALAEQQSPLASLPHAVMA